MLLFYRDRKSNAEDRLHSGVQPTLSVGTVVELLTRASLRIHVLRLPEFPGIRLVPVTTGSQTFCSSSGKLQSNTNDLVLVRSHYVTPGDFVKIRWNRGYYHCLAPY